MAKKYKYYLVRSLKDGFLYARGEVFECDIPGLALVKTDLYKDLNFKGDWSIIDIKTGLYVLKNHSRQKLLEAFTRRDFELLKSAIEKARITDNYKKRSKEADKEKQLWRDSGYAVEE